jgi:ubiquinone/menaquinone biosynthesis C-methylase UbiE
VNTYKLPFDDAAFEGIILFFAAHEIRNENERIQFFTEISRVAKPDGKILVMEHLRNLPNFMAYNIGFLHFFSNKNWMNCFAQAGLNVVAKANKTSFVTIYTLTPNGNSN